MKISLTTVTPWMIWSVLSKRLFALLPGQSGFNPHFSCTFTFWALLSATWEDRCQNSFSTISDFSCFPCFCLNYLRVSEENNRDWLLQFSPTWLYMSWLLLSQGHKEPAKEYIRKFNVERNPFYFIKLI